MMSADMEREEQRRRWEQNELSAVERMEQQEEARQEKMQVWCLCRTTTGQAQQVFVHCHHTTCKGPDVNGAHPCNNRVSCMILDTSNLVHQLTQFAP